MHTQGVIGKSMDDQPGMAMDADDTGFRAQAESMTGAAGEGDKAQQQVSTQLSVSTRAFIIMLMLSVKCSRQGERQKKKHMK